MLTLLFTIACKNIHNQLGTCNVYRHLEGKDRLIYIIWLCKSYTYVRVYASHRYSTETIASH